MQRTVAIEYVLRELRELAAVLPQIGPAREKIEALIEKLTARAREPFVPQSQPPDEK